jgi:L-ascorbate metabolism protein UlaG (beta-lactamase superfamily)
MKSFIKLILILVFNGNSVFPQASPKEFQVTYIGNEGFLLQSATNKILIDAVFSDGYGLFAAPSKEVIKNIIGMESPFDKINMLMLTHYHKDHCDPELMNEYLSMHRDIPFVTTKPSIVYINGNIFNFILLKKQFYEFTPELNECISTIVNNIPVKVYGLKHLSFYQDGIDMEENMYNVSFLVTMDGINIFHSGDIETNSLKNYIEKNGLWADTIDVAFLYFDLFQNGIPDLDYIVNTLNPRYIFLMHIPPSSNETWEAKTSELKTKFPNIIFMKDSMESRSISF